MVALVGALTALLIAIPTAAMASHFDNIYPNSRFPANCGDGNMGDTFCQTDNAGMTVYRENSITAAGQTSIAEALTSFNSTDLNVTYQFPPQYTGGSETDIIYQRRGDLPTGLAGIAWCDDAVSSTKCDQHYVAFRSTTPYRALACHETGHAVGLMHGADAAPAVSNTNSELGCMRTPVATSYTALGSWNVQQINSTY